MLAESRPRKPPGRPPLMRTACGRLTPGRGDTTGAPLPTATRVPPTVSPRAPLPSPSRPGPTPHPPLRPPSRPGTRRQHRPTTPTVPRPPERPPLQPATRTAPLVSSRAGEEQDGPLRRPRPSARHQATGTGMFLQRAVLRHDSLNDGHALGSFSGLARVIERDCDQRFP
jgi:hypothetical protein